MGGAVVDAVRFATGDNFLAYATVFAGEAVLLAVAFVSRSGCASRPRARAARRRARRRLSEAGAGAPPQALARRTSPSAPASSQWPRSCQSDSTTRSQRRPSTST